MKNPFESIKRAIKKMWSEAPSLATTELLKLFHTNPRLDGARVIASKCASTELYLYDRADFRKNKNKAEIIETHELYDLLDDPCPNIRELTGWHIKFFVFACYVVVGEAFLLKVRKPNGKIIALQPISPSWVVKTPTETGSYWEIYPYGTAGGNSIVVPREDVIYFKDINLLDPFGRGKGLSESIGDEIQSDEYASKYAKNLFFNDATPSAIIYAPNGNKESADQIKQTWLQKMAGFHHAKEPMVLTGEGSKFEKVSQSPTEMDFVNSRKFLRDSANEHYRLPPEIMGILQNSNRSTIDSAYYLLNKNVLADYLRMYERTMNTQLLWEDYDTDRKLMFRHENNIEEDIAQKLQIANSGVSAGTLTVNDWRVAMGFEKDERSGDVYLRSMATMEVPFNSEIVELPDDEPTEEKPTEEVELPETGGAEETQPDSTTEDGKELSEAEFAKLQSDYEKKYRVLKSDEDKERRVKIWKSFDARARSIEEPFRKSMVKAFTKQNELVNSTIKEAVKNGKDVGTAIENLYNKDMDTALKHTLAGAFTTGLTVGAEQAQSLLNKKSAKDITENVRRYFNQWIDSYGLELCKDMNKTTKKKLRKVLSEAITEGDDVRTRTRKLIEASDGMFDDDKKSRAVLIARTESCTTMNAGSHELYKAEGINYKEWISVQDDRTRDSHLVMDGTVVPINEKFEVPATSNSEGAFMEYAGDPTALAGQVANCRCTIAGVALLE
jgi:HK97 family phage portal protein